MNHMHEEIGIILFTKSRLPERGYKTLCTKPDTIVTKEFSGYITISFNEQVDLLNEIILHLWHTALDKMSPFLEKMNNLSQAIFESLRSSSLIWKKCAEMKGVFWMCPFLLKCMKKIISYATTSTKHTSTFKGTSINPFFILYFRRVREDCPTSDHWSKWDLFVQFSWQTCDYEVAFDDALGWTCIWPNIDDLIPTDDEFKSMEELVLPQR